MIQISSAEGNTGLPAPLTNKQVLQSFYIFTIKTSESGVFDNDDFKVVLWIPYIPSILFSIFSFPATPRIVLFLTYCLYPKKRSALLRD